MKAIILAAGVGRRLGIENPKCMIEIGGTSIIRRQLAMFAASGVDEFAIVVGYRQEQLIQHLADIPSRIHYIVNEQFAETNTIYSLYLARHHLNADTFYANADVLFDRRLLDRLRQHAFAPAALAIQLGRCGEEEVKVQLDNGRVRCIGKQLDPAICVGEFVGVARFNASFAPVLAEQLVIMVQQQAVVKDYFERAVAALCHQWEVYPVDVTDLPCREIDFPDDLTDAQQNIAPKLEE